METIQGLTYLTLKENSQKKYHHHPYLQQTQKLQLCFNFQLAARRRPGEHIYLKISPEKKAEIGKRAAEHGVLATIR